MRIAIDCRTLLNPIAGEAAGVGHYVYFLVQELIRTDQKNEYVLFFDHRLSNEAAEAFVGSAKNVEIAFFPFSEYQKYLPFVQSQYLTAAAIAKKKPDVVHIPGGGIPLSLKIPTVLTVHDLIIYEHPEWFPKQEISVRFLYPRSVRKAAHIIAVSHTTKEKIVTKFEKKDRDVSVIYPGVTVHNGVLATDISREKTKEDVQKKYDLQKPYVLFLGTIEPRKNVGMLVRGFVEAWKNSSQMRNTELVLAGMLGWGEKETMEIIRAAEKETRGSVRYVGYIPHEDKFPLIKHAAAFAFLSHDEGFGLPVLEAMAFGTPALVSNIPIFHEIAKNTALFVNQNDVKAIARDLEKIMTDEVLRAQLCENGLKNVQRFSWSEAAKETMRVYENTAAKL